MAPAPVPASAPKLALASPQADMSKPGHAARDPGLRSTFRCRRRVPPRPRKSSGASVRDMARRAKTAVMAAVAPPEKPPTIFERLFGKSESRGSLLSYASADVSSTSSLGPSQNIGAAGTVPMYDRQTAVYDISAHTVYLPDGTRLEAHSGLGSQLDDPNSARVQNARRDPAASVRPEAARDAVPRRAGAAAQSRSAATRRSMEGRACSRIPTCWARTAIPTAASPSGTTTPSCRPIATARSSASP